MNQFMSNLVCEGFSSCSTEIIVMKMLKCKKDNLMTSHFSTLYTGTPFHFECGVDLQVFILFSFINFFPNWISKI